MSRESVTYRLGVSGDQEIRATLAAIGESGDASSRRMARAFERDMRVLEAGAERAKRRYEQLKAIGSTTQREIAMQTGLDRSVFGDTKSAEASMRAFVMEQDKLTRSRERLIAQADPLFAAQQRYNATMAEAMRLDRAGALAKGDLAKVQARAKAELESLSVTQQGFTRSSGAMTSGLQQAGFQVSDFAVQVGGGTSAIRAASQQAPQLVQAMALMGMGAENTNSKFGKFTAFLAGPWGAAITVGVSLIGVFASKMGESDDASEKLSGALDFQRMSTEELTKAIDDQVRSAEDAIAVGAAAEIQARRTAEANLKEAISEREKTRAKLDGMLATERRSAGQGSAPIAHAAAKTAEPAREGVVGGLGPFIDTICICTLTAMVILSTGTWNRDSIGPLATEISLAAAGEGDEYIVTTAATVSHLPEQRLDQWSHGDKLFVLAEAQGMTHRSTGSNRFKITGVIDEVPDPEHPDAAVTLVISWGDVELKSSDWDGIPGDIQILEVEGGGAGIYREYEGAQLTAFAFDRVFEGLGKWLVTLAAWLFAISTMISWSYYGEKGVAFLVGVRGILPYKIAFLLLAIVGAAMIENTDQMMLLADLGTGSMLVVNIPIVLALGYIAVASLREYDRKLKAGEFSRNDGK